MEWAIFGATFVMAFILLAILGDNVRQKKKIAMQELIQKERLIALEKGLPLPEWDDKVLNDEKLPGNAEAHARRIEWFRVVTLCVGLVLTLGGAGMWLAFGLSSDTEFNKIASLGAIPIMAGTGLLLFNLLTSNRK